MIYTIEEIKNTAIPIFEEYGINRLSIFGSYARGDANNESDIIIQLGEYAGRLSDEFKYEHPDMDWQGIKNMRNIHAHNYDNILFDLTWEAITEDVPYLKEYLEKLL